MTLHLEDRRNASLRYRNRAEITFLCVNRNPTWYVFRADAEARTLAYEQALRGALAAGREKERELATTFLEFEYLHRKSRCEMLIGGDDISHDVITIGT